MQIKVQKEQTVSTCLHNQMCLKEEKNKTVRLPEKTLLTVHLVMFVATRGSSDRLFRGGHLCVSALSALSCFPRTLCPPGVDRKLPGLGAPPPSSTSCT